MKATANKPIVIAAGGTGGHFYPAEALAAELLARGERVVLITDARSGGLASSVFNRAEKHVVSGEGLAGRGAKRALLGAVQLAKGVVEARAIIKKLKPHAVVAFGGYPSVPPVLAAASLFGAARPRVILHEQNAVLGRANRFLARFATLLALNFATTSRVPLGGKTRIVGNPVRPAIAELHGHGYTPPGETIATMVLPAPPTPALPTQMVGMPNARPGRATRRAVSARVMSPNGASRRAGSERRAQNLGAFIKAGWQLPGGQAIAGER